MTTVHEFYEHLDALYEKGDAAGVEAYLTGIANSTYEEGRESDLMLSALNELAPFTAAAAIMKRPMPLL